MRRLVNALMLYKSMFAGPWFEALSKEEAPDKKEIYEQIMSETSEQARSAFDLLHRWDGMAEEGRTQRVTDQVLGYGSQRGSFRAADPWRVRACG